MLWMSLTKALDSAMCKVGSAEFRRLAANETPENRAIKVGQALASLQKLQSSQEPDYSDPWVVLFYMLWYQPGQINVAYTAIRRMLGFRSDENLRPGKDDGILHVFDIGCGALAMQFAAALLSGIGLECGEKIPEIHIDSYDPNKPMITLGKKLWHQYKLEIRKYPDLNVLSEAIKRIKPRASTAETIHMGGNIRGQSWVSAIHAIYPNNWRDVKVHLDRVKDRTKFHAGMITGYSGRESLFNLVSPLSGDQRRCQETDIELRIPTWHLFSETTSLRKRMHNAIEHLNVDSQYEGKDIIWYLNSVVTWSCREPRFLIYIDPG